MALETQNLNPGLSGSKASVLTLRFAASIQSGDILPCTPAPPTNPIHKFPMEHVHVPRPGPHSFPITLYPRSSGNELLLMASHMSA